MNPKANKINLRIFFKLISTCKRINKFKFVFTIIISIFTGLLEFLVLSNLVNIFSILGGETPKASISLCENQLSILCGSNSNSNIYYLFSFLIIIILSFILRIISSFCIYYSSYSISGDIGKSVFSNIIRMNYRDHISQNTSNIIGLCVSDIENTSLALEQLILFINNSIIALFILFGMIYGGSEEIFLILGFILIFYAVNILLTRKRLRRNGFLITNVRYKAIDIVRESMGNLLNIILDRSHLEAIDNYDASNKVLRKLSHQNTFIKLIPRILVESSILFFLAIAALLITIGSSNLVVEDLLPILGILAIGSQRLFQFSQQSFYSWTSLVIGSQSADNLLSKIRNKSKNSYGINVSKNNRFVFEKINLNNINYLYDNSKTGLLNFDIQIKRGEVIGILGSTGAGKTTLINLLMGLNFPQTGQFKINDYEVKDFYKDQVLIDFQTKCSYVPQKIYLMNASLLENITYQKKEQVDFDRLEQVLIKSELKSVVNKLPLGLETKIGEHGMKLSGGQQQRIGIARALYKKDFEVLFLDEATNALDMNTENKIINNLINSGEKSTIIMIAHRIQTLKNCTRVIEINNGILINDGKPSEIISNWQA